MINDLAALRKRAALGTDAPGNLLLATFGYRADYRPGALADAMPQPWPNDDRPQCSPAAASYLQMLLLPEHRARAQAFVYDWCTTAARLSVSAPDAAVPALLSLADDPSLGFRPYVAAVVGKRGRACGRALAYPWLDAQGPIEYIDVGALRLAADPQYDNTDALPDLASPHFKPWTAALVDAYMQHWFDYVRAHPTKISRCLPRLIRLSLWGPVDVVSDVVVLCNQLGEAIERDLEPFEQDWHPISWRHQLLTMKAILFFRYHMQEAFYTRK